MKIGIVGAENSHTVAVAKTLNIDKACGSARVAMVWGETREAAEKAAQEGQIPEIVRRPEDMIGRIDGVMIDHRHAKYHVPAAIPFVEAGIPSFVDKPFSYTVEEGAMLLKLARKKGAPITSYSVLAEQTGYRKDFLKQIRSLGRIMAIESSGPGDFRSKWGGVFFYGVHQVDTILKAFGPGIEKVQAFRASSGNPCGAAVLSYSGGGPIVTMHLVSGGKCGFTFRAFGTKGVVHYENKFDPNMYLTGIKKFLNMFRTGKEPFTAREILEPIAILEALARSFRLGKAVRVEKVPNV